MTPIIKKTDGKKHLLIPDSHASPNENLRRYEWLGNLIMEEMPDVIIDIGDWWDMGSLCTHDVGTKSAEGRRYKADVEAGHAADKLAFGPIVKYNNTRSRAKKKHYSPRIIRTLGNHEQRIVRYSEKQDPKLIGTVGLTDIAPRLTDLNFTVSPFLAPSIVDGVAYCHYFVSGTMGRPIGSAHLLIQKHFMSCTQGHQHTRDWAEGVRADGIRVQGLICGSYHDPDHNSTYADQQSEGRWWNGLYVKRDVFQGQYDKEEISVDAMRKRYG
jgi:hypothetical protein